MKRIFGIVLLAVFLLSFGAGYLLSLNTASAAPPCSTSCVGLKCPLNSICACNSHTGCCRCERFVG